MTWPAIAIGILGIIIGIAVIINKKRIASGVAEGQRQTFGRPGEALARQSKPIGAVIAGGAFIVIGVIAILMGLFISPDQF